ncbi:hypothetical protein HDU96_009732 [Phlyctochytrium bullatum]|nr:hypothetical protein HDU96_009732 [Phlyctochytrium bullatum]
MWPKEHINSMVNAWSTNRKGGTLVLQGASGIGKSTLVKHFIDECNRKDILLVPLVGDILPELRVKENDFTNQLNGDARASILLSMIVRIVKRLLDRGTKLALVFDDAQWLDTSTLAIVLRLIEEVPQYVSEGAELIARSVENKVAARALEKSRLASWLAMCAFSHAKRKVFDACRKEACQSLSLLSIDVDAMSGKKIAKATRKAAIRQLILFFKSKGGTKLLRRRDHHNRVVTGGSRTFEEEARLYSFLGLLYNSFHSNNVSKEVGKWALFETLNAIIPTAANYPAQWVSISVQAAFAMFWGARGLSKLYMKPFYTVGEKIGDAKHMESVYVAFVYILSCNWNKAIDVLENYIR